MTLVTREEVHAAVVEMLAAELQCSPAHLMDGEIHVVERLVEGPSPLPGRRITRPAPCFSIGVAGAGGVVSVSPQWSGWAREACAGIPQSQLLGPHLVAHATRRVEAAGNSLSGPYPRFVASGSDLRPAPMPAGYRLELAGPEVTRVLNAHDWPNGLERNAFESKPLVTAALAYAGVSLAGLAGLTADTDRMWQIGLDVVPEHQGRRIGRALTSVLANEALTAGRVPFYATSAANIPSMRTALSLGFLPGWVEVVTAHRPPERARVDDPEC